MERFEVCIKQTDKVLNVSVFNQRQINISVSIFGKIFTVQALFLSLLSKNIETIAGIGHFLTSKATNSFIFAWFWHAVGLFLNCKKQLQK